MISKYLPKPIYSLSIMIVVLVAMLTMIGVDRLVENSSKNDLVEVSRRTNKPNVIIINLDDLDQYTLEQMLKNNRLPNIGALYDQGIEFSNAFVTRSVCCSSRATLLTGMYAHNHGVWAIDGDEGPQAFANYKSKAESKLGDKKYIPSYLKDAGYKTIFIGKHHLDLGPNAFNDWDYWRRIDSYDPRPASYQVSGNNLPESEKTPNQYQVKYIGDKSVEAMRNSGNNPFFLLVAPSAVHTSVNIWTKLDQKLSTNDLEGEPVAFSTYQANGSILKEQMVTKVSRFGVIDFLYFDRDVDYKKIGLNSTIGWKRAARDSSDIAIFTNSEEIKAFNTISFKNGTKVQQLVRGENPAKFFSREYKNNKWGKWQFLSAEDVFPGIGNKNVAGWSALEFPNGIIRQEIIIGDPEYGYEGYMRHRLPGKQFTQWRYDPDWGEVAVQGEIVDFDQVVIDSIRVKSTLITKSLSGEFHFNESSVLVDFQSLAYESERSRNIPDLAQDVYGDEDLLYQSLPKYGKNDSWLTVSLPDSRSFDKNYDSIHPYYVMRAYTEGSWDPVLSGQVYSYNNGLPAGTLRVGRNINGFKELSGYGLPLQKPNYNAPHKEGLPDSYYDDSIWPNLQTQVSERYTQEDYLNRLHLDMQETLISVDKMVGEIVRNAPQNTMIIFTSDNGHINGEFRLSNKVVPIDESIRVPLVVKLPSTYMVQNHEINNLVANVDIAPTIYDFLGLSWRHTDGRSLKILIDSGNNYRSRSWRKSLLVEHRTKRVNGKPILEDNWVWGIPDYHAIRSIYQVGARNGNYMYTQYYFDADKSKIRNYESYDMIKDPYQLNNLENSKSLDYGKLIDRFKNCNGYKCRSADRFSVK